eukprot:gb/GECG01000391.1/.p1 GENE.gb/GECG01000391.1/~~gb/GECG01000391.1/.p1  ORF type:complete len:982 (+),score=75.56 gb/GECG01000391.1/:1-2946(+)
MIAVRTTSRRNGRVQKPTAHFCDTRMWIGGPIGLSCQNLMCLPCHPRSFAPTAVWSPCIQHVAKSYTKAAASDPTGHDTDDELCVAYTKQAKVESLPPKKKKKQWSDRDEDKEPVPEELEDAVYRNYLLLKRSTDPEVIQKMIDFEGENFNAVNIATLLNRIVKDKEVVKSLSRREIDRLLVLTLSRLKTHPREFGALECSTIVHAMGTFGPKRNGTYEELREQLITRFCTACQEPAEVELVNMIWGYSRTKGASKNAWARLIDNFTKRINSMDIQGFSTVMYSLGYVCNDPDNYKDVFTSSVYKGCADPVREVNQLISYPEGFLPAIKIFLAENASRFRMRHLGNILYGVAALGIRDKDVFRLSSQIFQTAFDDLDIENVVNTLWAFSKSNHADRLAFQGSVQTINRHILRSMRSSLENADQRKTVSVQNIIKVLWAYRIADIVEAKLFKTAAQYLAQRINDLNAHQLTTASWVFATGGIQIQEFWEELRQRLTFDKYVYTIDVDSAVFLYWSLSYARAGDTYTNEALMRVISHNRGNLDHVTLPKLVEALGRRQTFPTRLLRDVSIHAAALLQYMPTKSIINVATVYGKSRISNVDHLYNAMARSLETRMSSSEVSPDDICRACSILASTGQHTSNQSSYFLTQASQYVASRVSGLQVPQLVDALWAIVVTQHWDSNFIRHAFESIVQHAQSSHRPMYDSLSALMHDELKLSRLHLATLGTAYVAPPGCAGSPACLPEWLLSQCREAYHSVQRKSPPSDFANVVTDIIHREGYIQPSYAFLDPVLGVQIDIAWHDIPTYDTKGELSFLKVALFLDSRKRFVARSRKSRKDLSDANENQPNKTFQNEISNESLLSPIEPSSLSTLEETSTRLLSYSSSEGSGWSDSDSASDGSQTPTRKGAHGLDRMLLPVRELERILLEAEGWTVVSINYREVTQTSKDGHNSADGRRSKTVEHTLAAILAEKLPSQLQAYGRQYHGYL